MEKFLKIYDDIIPSYQQDYIENLLTCKFDDTEVCWRYSSNITDSKTLSPTPREYGFSLKLAEGYSPHRTTLLSPLYKFCDSQQYILKEISLIRSFLIPPSPFAGIQTPHTDQDDPHLVFLYYVTDADGDTVFYKDDRKTIINKISPKKGRIAVFDGSIPHSGSSPTKSTRIVINANINIIIPS
jgi:hypothetical protein